MGGAEDVFIDPRPVDQVNLALSVHRDERIHIDERPDPVGRVCRGHGRDHPAVAVPDEDRVVETYHSRRPVTSAACVSSVIDGESRCERSPRPVRVGV